MEQVLVIEVDGKVHDGRKEYDEGRTLELEELGLTVIQFTNEEVINDIDNVIEEITKHIE